MIEGKVKIPNSYFLKMAKHDYENYRCALCREFYQNSIDAGSKNINVKITDNTVEVIDDGCGMNLDTLQNKLLVLGGSFKSSEDSVGAFGKAKEVLFFSWEKYTIRTQDLLVEGTGAEYKITQGLETIKGTTCKIWLPSEELKMRWYFSTIAKRIQTRTKIFVDGNRAMCRSKRGRIVRTIPGVGNIHQVKVRNSTMMQVRINGIWMFDQYVGDNMGTLILELSGKSLDVMTSNRDGFKWETRSTVSRLIEDLTVNKSAAFKKDRPRVKVNIPGSGKVVVGEEYLAAAKMKFESNNSLKDAIKSMLGAPEEMTAIQKARITAAPNIVEKEWDDFVEAIKFIGYKPDFVLLQYDDEDKSKFIASKKARLLATMWTEIIKQVMLDNKRYLEFTAGFTFEKDIEASISKDDNGVTIYLNPNLIKTGGHRRVLMECLKDLAIHELAHLRFPNHDNDFVNEMAEIRKNTYADDRPYYAIQRTRV